MKSIDFPGAYLKIGEGQSEYHTIHAMPIEGPEGEVICVYQLTEEEIRQIVETKTLFYSRWTFGNVCQCKKCGSTVPVGFQPMRIQTDPPHIKVKLSYPDGSLVEVDGELRPDGVHVPGYQKTASGQYVKIDGN